MHRQRSQQYINVKSNKTSGGVCHKTAFAIVANILIVRSRCRELDSSQILITPLSPEDLVNFMESLPLFELVACKIDLRLLPEIL